MSRVVYGLKRPRRVLGFRSVTLRPNLSVGLPLSKLKLPHGDARNMPLFKRKSIEFWVVSPVSFVQVSSPSVQLVDAK
jgi:hypothetical protein